MVFGIGRSPFLWLLGIFCISYGNLLDSGWLISFGILTVFAGLTGVGSPFSLREREYVDYREFLRHREFLDSRESFREFESQKEREYRHREFFERFLEREKYLRGYGESWKDTDPMHRLLPSIPSSPTNPTKPN